MKRSDPAAFQLPRMKNLSPEERKSLTHGEFWIPDEEREVYKLALRTLNAAGVPYVVAGAYAIYEHTGIYRQTGDLDVFCTPATVPAAMEALRGAGFRTKLAQGHWLAKAYLGEHFVDVIFGMGNGLALIDEDWHRHSVSAVLAATDVRMAPPEELIWHRLFINERHRHDMADIAHLILCVGHRMDWERLLRKAGEHWPLLLSQLLLFRYVYPGYTQQVNAEVLNELLERARADAPAPAADDAGDDTRGTMISRFSFAIDVNEWGFRDLREEMIQAMERHPAVLAVGAADVWDERADAEPDAPPEPVVAAVAFSGGGPA